MCIGSIFFYSLNNKIVGTSSSSSFATTPDFFTVFCQVQIFMLLSHVIILSAHLSFT